MTEEANASQASPTSKYILKTHNAPRMRWPNQLTSRSVLAAATDRWLFVWTISLLVFPSSLFSQHDLEDSDQSATLAISNPPLLILDMSLSAESGNAASGGER